MTTTVIGLENPRWMSWTAWRSANSAGLGVGLIAPAESRLTRPRQPHCAGASVIAGRSGNSKSSGRGTGPDGSRGTSAGRYRSGASVCPLCALL